MQTRVQRWGNSLAVRIPKVFATDAGLNDDVLVDLTLVDGRLIIAPVIDSPMTLAQLLADITDANIHHEVDWDGPMGNEVW